MSFFIEKAIGSKVESAGKTLGLNDGDAEKEAREKKQKELKEKKEMENKKQKYLEERRVKRHEENKAKNDKIRNKYTFAEKEEKHDSGISFFTKEEPKKIRQPAKKNPETTQICVVDGCHKSASVVQPVCPQCDQPVCYSHRLEADHPCSAVAAVKGAAGSVFDSVLESVESLAAPTTGESGTTTEKKSEEPKIVQRGLGENPNKQEDEEEISWDSISRKLEETKESFSDAVDRSLREFNLAGESELTEEEKRYWGGMDEAGKETPPHHLDPAKEEEKSIGEHFDEVTTSISSWFSGEKSEEPENQQKESEGSSFFSSWF
uniref:AN1-type domain-containing protein n=1 Tax=Paramoeba aestuarina TaxID=180227 RepID=A0A7S4JII3_9EUKA|mmetsp:Transcript_10745/g.16187  ORF Transcript_10745/g.16187 Transcript_10745/m.16187 type:complete len:320 (+) Transcript_10745:32-991(+)